MVLKQPIPHSSAFFLFSSCMAEVTTEVWEEVKGKEKKKKKSSFQRKYEIRVVQQTTKLVNFLKKRSTCFSCLFSLLFLGGSQNHRLTERSELEGTSKII